jgi:Zn-dependent protease
MFDVPSFRVGKIFGIPFEINMSWIIVFAIVALVLSTSYFPGVAGAQGASPWLLGALGVVTALLFFASVLAHELCHAIVAKLEGGHVEKITLFIFGGVAQIEEEPKSPLRELLMAAAGPGMSLLLAGIAYLGSVVAVGHSPWWVVAPLQYLAFINLLVGLFNLLPGFPLDGGRVFRAILWAITGSIDKATRWATGSGQVIGWLMVALGVLAFTQGDVANGIWFGLVGWFIAWLAGASYRQQLVQSRLGGLTVERVMTPHPEYVEGEIPVETFVNEHLLGRQHGRYPVIFEGAIVGVVALADVKRIARAEWPNTRVVDIADRDLSTVSVDASMPVIQTLPRLAADKPGALLVVKAGHLAGIITRSDVIEVLNQAPLS